MNSLLEFPVLGCIMFTFFAAAPPFSFCFAHMRVVYGRNRFLGRKLLYELTHLLIPSYLVQTISLWSYAYEEGMFTKIMNNKSESVKINIFLKLPSVGAWLQTTDALAESNA